VQRLLSHIDLRVRDGARALAFYDAFLAEFGFQRVTEAPFTEDEPTWRPAGWSANDEFFGFVIDPEFTPNENRIAFHAADREQVDRVTSLLRTIGARDIDGPEGYDGYYATFFEDPDGNLLEVCYLARHQGLTGTANKVDLIRGFFDAFRSKNRAFAEELLADDFTFTSPYDNAIDKATYFERCWPGSEYIERQAVEQIFVEGDEAFVRYCAKTRDGKEFSNTEFFTFAGDKIHSVSVYFGASYKNGAFMPQPLSS
jgi:catechol 2,3-dioxygenase-like lactoylglutathione lyase family enzyme/ketosteroid isomerase-like protein